MPERNGRRTATFIVVVTGAGLLIQVCGLGQGNAGLPATAEDVNRANANALGIRQWRRALDDFHSAGMHPERTILATGGASLLVIIAGRLTIRALRRRSRRPNYNK